MLRGQFAPIVLPAVFGAIGFTPIGQQDVTNGVGLLSIFGADGGAHNLRESALSSAAPCVPMTDPAQAGPGFIPAVTPPASNCTDPTRPFDLYTTWSKLPSRTGFASVARGEQLFNTRRFTFATVPGTFTCTGCHTTTNVGNFPFVNPDNAAPNASLFVRYGLNSPSSWLSCQGSIRA